MSLWEPIVSGLLGAAVVGLLARGGRRPAKRVGTRRALTFGVGCKLLVAVLVPASLFVAYAASQAGAGQRVLAFCIAAGFLATAAFSAYLVFCVKLEYDASNIYFSSLLAGHHQIPWADVLGLGYSGLAQCNYIRTRQVPRIWCSNMMQGFEEFGEFLEKKAEELYGKEP